MKKKKTSTEIINTINNFLYKKKLILPKQNILIALSGGQDSICLVFILINLQTQWNCKITLTSCNHMWQKDSFEVMRQIHKLSFLFCIRFFLLITSKKLFNEQKARNWRQYSWQRLLVFSASNWLLTGHTASDRIETLLFQLMRGSGTKGILSLYWQKAMFNPLNKKKFDSSFYKFYLSYPSVLFPVTSYLSFGAQQPIMNNFLQKNLWMNVFICEMEKKVKKQILDKKKLLIIISVKRSEAKKNFKLLENYIYFFKYTQKIMLPSPSKMFNNKTKFYFGYYIYKVPQLTCRISKKFLVKAFFSFYFF